MTAKDKAKELVDRLKAVTRPMSKRNTLMAHMHPEHAKQCALICVDEVLETYIYLDPKLNYWKKVKKEIEKI